MFNDISWNYDYRGNITITLLSQDVRCNNAYESYNSCRQRRPVQCYKHIGAKIQVSSPKTKNLRFKSPYWPGGAGKEKPGGKIGIPLAPVPIPNGNSGTDCWPVWLVPRGRSSPRSSRRLPSRFRRHRDPSLSSSPAPGRVDLGPCLPLLSVCIRRLMALEETPAPISMSGSSTTSPVSIGLPPLPPYSAVNIHFRSASVNRLIGMILMPV